MHCLKSMNWPGTYSGSSSLSSLQVSSFECFRHGCIWPHSTVLRPGRHRHQQAYVWLPRVRWAHDLRILPAGYRSRPKARADKPRGIYVRILRGSYPLWGYWLWVILERKKWGDSAKLITSKTRLFGTCLLNTHSRCVTQAIVRTVRRRWSKD